MDGTNHQNIGGFMKLLLQVLGPQIIGAGPSSRIGKPLHFGGFGMPKDRGESSQLGPCEVEKA